MVASGENEHYAQTSKHHTNSTLEEANTLLQKQTMQAEEKRSTSADTASPNTDNWAGYSCANVVRFLTHVYFNGRCVEGVGGVLHMMPSALLTERGKSLRAKESTSLRTGAS